MNNTVSIDDTQVLNLFNALDSESTNQILFTALKKGGQRLTSLTKTNLKRKLGKGATTPNRWNGKTMESGIKFRGDKDYCEVAVSIMGDFRLKFFEKGTKPRLTRKTNANRGSITALNFFQSARANDNEITATINNSITNSLNRLKK